MGYYFAARGQVGGFFYPVCVKRDSHPPFKRSFLKGIVMGTRAASHHRTISAILSLLMLLMAMSSMFNPAFAGTASTDVKAKIDAKLTPFIPNVTETRTTTGTVTFVHPGVGMNKLMLDNMRDRVRAGEEPWASAFLNFSNIGSSQTAPLMRNKGDNPQMVDIPGGGSPSTGLSILMNMAQDAHTAWAQTIMWYITGNEVYRKNAMTLLRNWSKVQSIGSIYDEQIRVSLAVYQFTYAADILRSSPSNTSAYDWTSDDTTAFISYLNIMKSKYNRAYHFMNQHTMCVMATMGSAVFRDSDADYALAIQRATTNPEQGTNYDFSDPTNGQDRSGSILAMIRSVTKNVSTGATVPANVQWMEMARDQQHPYVGLGGLSAAAMTSYIQGTKVDPVQGTISTAANSVNMFHFLDDRLLAGANYLTKYNLGYDVTFIPSYLNQTGTGQVASAPTTGDRGVLQTTVGIVYNYYKYIERRSDMDTNESTKYLAQAFSKIYPENDNQDMVGHGVLLYTLEDKSNLAPQSVITASSSWYVIPLWERLKIADGRTGSDTYSSGWSSANSTSVSHTEWVRFDFGRVVSINEVDMYPRNDGPNLGYGFPIDFTIDVSLDNVNWTAVVIRTNQPIPTGVQKFNFGFQNARYVRIQGTRLRANPNDANQYRMQLAEARIYGDYRSTGAAATASSSMENADWSTAKSNDGKRTSLPASMGWSSTVSASTFTEWLTLDMGASKFVGEVNLYPRNDGVNTGYGYPIDFTIDTSEDGSTWTTAVTKTGIALPADGATQAFSFGVRSARYVRIQGTSHRANPNDAYQVRMQLTEVEVY